MFNQSEIRTTTSSYQFFRDFNLRTQAITISLLRRKDTNQSLVIGNTHLYSNPIRTDIKTMQSYATILAIDKFLQSNQLSSTEIPIILCGDFNTFPTTTEDSNAEIDSAAFRLFRTGKLDNSHPAHPDRWYQKLSTNTINPMIGRLSTNLTFRHIYLDHPIFRHYTPAFTTKTNNFHGCIDHIWVNNRIGYHQVMLTPVINNRGCLQSSEDNADQNNENNEDKEDKIENFPPIPNQVKSI